MRNSLCCISYNLESVTRASVSFISEIDLRWNYIYYVVRDLIEFNDHFSKVAEPGWNPFQKLGIMITKPGKKKFLPQRALSAPVRQFRDHLISPSKIGFRSHFWGHPLGLLEVKNWSWSNFPIKSNLDFGNLESKPIFSSWILGGRVSSWEENFTAISK